MVSRFCASAIKGSINKDNTKRYLSNAEKRFDDKRGGMPVSVFLLH
jgi:hypothetical protein